MFEARHKSKYFRWLIGILLALLGAVPVVAQAQSTPEASSTLDDTVWFLIVPEGKNNGSFFEIELNAGETGTLTGTFGNGSAIPVEAIVYAADAVPRVNGGFSIGDSTSETSAPTTWLDFPTAKIDFEAGASFERSFTVAVPADTLPGQFVTGVTIETAEAEIVPGESGLQVKYRLVTPVVINVPGVVTAGFEVRDIRATVEEFLTTVTGTIENTGNTRVRPSGKLTLSSESGIEVVSANINMGSVYLGQTTTFEIILPSPILAGTYTSSVVLEDPDTGATAAIESQRVEVDDIGAPKPIEITAATISPMPSAENLVFVQVSATVTNTGLAVSGIELELVVFRDGEEVDRVVLGSSITLQTGDTTVNQPYLPASGIWDSGEYTFALSLNSTDSQTGTRTSIDMNNVDTVIEGP